MIDFSFISNYNNLESAFMKAQNSMNRNSGSAGATKKATSKWMDVIEGWSKQKQDSTSDAKAGTSASDTRSYTYTPTGTDRYDEYLRQIQSLSGSQSSKRVASSPWMEKVLNMPNTRTSAQAREAEGTVDKSTTEAAGTATSSTATGNTSWEDRRQEQMDMLRQFASTFGNNSSWIW